MDWIHCNRCFVTPSRGFTPQFWFSACGHLVCGNCLKASTGQTRTCIVCHKQTQYIGVNSKMKPKVLAFFRPPKELLTEYSARVKQVMEFQGFQVKHLQDKATKYVQKARAEVQQSKQQEHMAKLERNNLKQELDRSKEKTRLLEKMLHNAKKELQHMMAASQQKRSNGGGVGRANSSMSAVYHHHNPHHHRNVVVYPTATASSSAAANRSMPYNRSFKNFHNNTPATVVGAFPPYDAGGRHPRSPFTSMSNSFYNNTMSSTKSTTPLLRGRITKGPIIPRSLDIHRHDRNNTESFDS